MNKAKTKPIEADIEAENQTVDYSRKWYVMSAVGSSVFLATVDGSIVNVALPTLVRDFGTTFAIVQWVVLAYLLTQTVLILGIGRLGDMIGKKIIYTSGFVVFTISSVLCGLAPAVYWLIGFRVLQAVGAAMMLALGSAIITEAFPPSERGRALGLIGSVVSVGIITGPVLGGLLIEELSWHWIFFVNLPVGIVGTWLAWRFVPDIKPTSRQPFDYGGAFTLFVTLLALLLALTLGQDNGFTTPPILILFGISAIFLVLFVWIQTHVDQPMVEPSLFKNKLFSINLVTGFMIFVAIAGALILLPFYLENVLGYNTRDVGLLLAVMPLALGIAAPISGSLSDRLGVRPITISGLLVLLIGYVSLSSLSTDTGTWGYLLRLLPIGIGMGIFQSPNNSAVMGAVSRQRLGVASGLLTLTRTLGQTTGIAILGAVWAGRVIFYEGGLIEGGATAASAAAQVAGLQDTFLMIVVIIVGALGLSIWGLYQERRMAQKRQGTNPG